MTRRRWTLAPALAALALTGCGGSDESNAARPAASTATPARTAQPTATDGRAGVKVGQSRLGPILVDASGRTLYEFRQDKPGRSLCTSDYLNCPESWPPLLTTGRPRAQGDVKPGLLGSIHRRQPAGTQVSYHDRPLYRYVEDKRPGDVEGQGYFGYWYVLSPSGRPIKKK